MLVKGGGLGEPSGEHAGGRFSGSPIGLVVAGARRGSGKEGATTSAHGFGLFICFGRARGKQVARKELHEAVA